MLNLSYFNPSIPITNHPSNLLRIHQIRLRKKARKHNHSLLVSRMQLRTRKQDGTSHTLFKKRYNNSSSETSQGKIHDQSPTPYSPEDQSHRIIPNQLRQRYHISYLDFNFDQYKGKFSAEQISSMNKDLFSRPRSVNPAPRPQSQLRESHSPDLSRKYKKIDQTEKGVNQTLLQNHEFLCTGSKVSPILMYPRIKSRGQTSRQSESDQDKRIYNSPPPNSKHRRQIFSRAAYQTPQRISL